MSVVLDILQVLSTEQKGCNGLERQSGRLSEVAKGKNFQLNIK